MRFLIRTRIPAEPGNKMIQDPNFLTKLEEYMNKVKPEAAYFMPIDGHVLSYLTSKGMTKFLQ